MGGSSAQGWFGIEYGTHLTTLQARFQDVNLAQPGHGAGEPRKFRNYQWGPAAFHRGRQAALRFDFWAHSGDNQASGYARREPISPEKEGIAYASNQTV